MLADVITLLACPVCTSDVELDEDTVVCERGHTFDVARQGYVSLLAGSATKFTGDSAEMLAARENFLRAGHFDPLVEAIVTASELPSVAAVLEVGAGTGHYLARVLDAEAGAVGLGVDVSKPAARRIARAHPSAASVVADGWQRLPVRDGSFDLALSIFAPRNPVELGRVLSAAGEFVVATPTPRHLAELIEPLSMVAVEPDKASRLSDSMSGTFERMQRRLVEFAMTLPHSDVAAVVGMGPSAYHGSDSERAQRIAELPDPITVTASVVVSRYRPRVARTSE